MKKLKVYLDTTIFNFVFADDAPIERDLTRRFFSQISHFDVFISDIVIEEIAECPAPKRQKMMDLIDKYNIQELPLDEASRQLAIKYVKEGIIPIKYQDDALHIAIASVNEMDLLLSWNFQHIVKLKTKRESVGVNMLMGYGSIEIYTPREVVEDV
jgi:rRNA-processing protein FCF1